MKKRAFAIAIVFSVMINLTACAKSTPTDDPKEEPSTPVETITEVIETITEIIETPISPEKVIEVEKTQMYTMKGCEYLVPESWTEKVSSENLKYYYPQDGMLMVGFDEVEASIYNETARKLYIDGISSSLDNFELISEKEISVDGKKAYRFEMKFLINGEENEHSMVTFDYSNGIMSFWNITEKDSINEFDRIISSIKLNEAKVEEEDSYKNDNIIGFKTDEFSVVYERHEVGKDYKGDPCLYYYYTFTNKSSKNQSAAFSINVQAFQNGIECDITVSTSGLSEIQNFLKEIQPNASIEVCEVFGLTDDSEITIEAGVLISFSEEKDVQVITLP
ncbi:MAG: DUF5067 domain-containing protein [Clostridiaceae bacterium]